jgi:hypothetical protein
LELQQLLDERREGASAEWIEAVENETKQAFLTFLRSLGSPSPPADHADPKPPSDAPLS